MKPFERNNILQYKMLTLSKYEYTLIQLFWSSLISDISFFPRPITMSTWTVESMFSQTSEPVCKWRTSVASLSNMCQDQFPSKAQGNRIPPSPGDESVFWRGTHQAANFLSTTVDIRSCVGLALRFSRSYNPKHNTKWRFFCVIIQRIHVTVNSFDY